MSYPGIYRAKAIKLDGHLLSAYIPQVFGDAVVTIENFVGDAPTTDIMGWVAFHGGNPEFPVWVAGVSAAAFQTLVTQATDSFGEAIDSFRDEVWYTQRVDAFWQYANQATTPPGSGQMRTDVPITSLYIHKIDTDGYDRTAYLDYVVNATKRKIDSLRFRVRGTNGMVYELRSNGLATTSGTYYTIPVRVISGDPGAKGFRVELTMLSGIWAEDEPV